MIKLLKKTYSKINDAIMNRYIFRTMPDGTRVYFHSQKDKVGKILPTLAIEKKLRGYLDRLIFCYCSIFIIMGIDSIMVRLTGYYINTDMIFIISNFSLYYTGLKFYRLHHSLKDFGTVQTHSYFHYIFAFYEQFKTWLFTRKVL